MNVLQFYRTYMPESHGGIEEAIRQICIGSGQYGIKHRILTLAHVAETEIIERPEATVIRAPLQWDPASCSMGMELFRLYREHASWADVIHIHYPWPFADLVHVLSFVRKPVVVTYHSDIIRQSWLERLYSPLRKLFFRSVSATVATSPNYMNSSDFLKKFEGELRIIPLGLSPDSYQSPSLEAKQTVLEQFGDEFFLFVGVLRYYKGLQFLVDAAKRTGLQVVIAGRGPEEHRLRSQVKELGLVNVHFAGFVSDDVRAALFEHCRAVVFPSYVRSEAFGVTLLEGSLFAKPLISCEIGTGTTFVNIDGETGLVIPPGNSWELAMAMRSLSVDSGLASEMGKASRRRLESVFSGDKVGRAYRDLYQEVVSKVKHP